MNTTRIQIAELIEPFMEKEYKFENLIIEKYVFLKNYEILWPEQCTYFYDITAVLKYIVSKWFEYRDNWYFNIKIHNWDEFETTLLNLPYKPLILYSPDEELELLKLLKKIK